MYSKTETGKASKGTAGVSATTEGMLRLSFPRLMFGGKQKFVALGLKDTPENRLVAEKKALQVNLDISNNEFDFTLEKYKPVRHLAVVVQLPVVKTQLKLDELWKQYVDYRRPNVSPSTVRGLYNRIANHISELPTKNISDSIAIKDYLVKNKDLTAKTIDKIAESINACCNWALESELIDANPFTKLFKEIKKPKPERNTDEDFDNIKPFTAEERNRIIAAFESNQYCSKFTGKDKKHSNYAPYVKFLFFTGCRPSEAIALRWGDISDDYVIFRRAVVQGENGLVEKEGLKTQRKRRFPVNNQLREILDSFKPKSIGCNDLVFPSPISKGWIDVGNFCTRIWTPLLKQMGIEYRKPYNTRHTFITLCTQTPDFNIKRLAQLVGNSPQVILEHYLGATYAMQVPEL